MADPSSPAFPVAPVRLFTEEELDALEATDPDRAYRIARAQAMAARAPRPAHEVAGPPDPQRVREAVDDVREVLRRDGGDIELVDIQGTVVRVRMKGACAGCPNSVIDLKNLVEKVVTAVPGVTGVRNVF